MSVGRRAPHQPLGMQPAVRDRALTESRRLNTGMQAAVRAARRHQWRRGGSLGWAAQAHALAAALCERCTGAVSLRRMWAEGLTRNVLLKCRSLPCAAFHADGAPACHAWPRLHAHCIHPPARLPARPLTSTHPPSHPPPHTPHRHVSIAPVCHTWLADAHQTGRTLASPSDPLL